MKTTNVTEASKARRIRGTKVAAFAHDARKLLHIMMENQVILLKSLISNLHFD